MSSNQSSLSAFQSDEPERGRARAAWIIGEQVIRLGVGLMLSVWMVRLLGPHDFGRLNYAVSIAAILGVASTLGLNRILVREIVSHRDDYAWGWSLLQTAVRLRIWAAIGLNILGLLLSFISGSDDGFMVLVLTLGLFFAAFDSIDLYFQAKLGTTGLVKARLVSFALVSLVRIAMLTCQAPVQVFAGLYLLDAAAGALAINFYLHRKENPLRLGPIQRPGLGVLLIKESWPEVIAGFSGLLFMRMDQIMLQHMVGPEAVGQFAAAARLSELWYFVPNAIVAASYPTLLAAREVSRITYQQRLRKMMSKLVALSYVAVLGVLLLGDYVVEFVYGRGYLPASGILIIHIWCGVLVVLALASGLWLMAEHLVICNMLRNIFGAFVNVVLNLLLIPHYGAEGAAVATLFSFVFAYLVYDFLDPRMRQIGRMKIQSLLLWDGFLWLMRSR